VVEHTFERGCCEPLDDGDTTDPDSTRTGSERGPNRGWSIELLAYAAGVIDSDGSTGIRLDTCAMRVRRLEAGPVYKERVTLRQIEPQAVELFHGAFGGSRFMSAPRNERAQPLHSWQVVDRMAATFLAAISPYLRIKRRQAELCVELRRLKDESRKARFAYGRGHRGGGPRPDDLTMAMADLRAEILRLNQVQGRAARSSLESAGGPTLSA
jgi:hypothetical protein